MRIKEGRPLKAGGVQYKPAIKAGGLEWPFAGLNGRRRTKEGRPFKGRQPIFFSAILRCFPRLQM